MTRRSQTKLPLCEQNRNVIVALPGSSNHFLVIQSLDEAIPAGQLHNAVFKFLAPILQHVFLQRQTHTRT